MSYLCPHVSWHGFSSLLSYLQPRPHNRIKPSPPNSWHCGAWQSSKGLLSRYSPRLSCASHVHVPAQIAQRDVQSCDDTNPGAKQNVKSYPLFSELPALASQTISKRLKTISNHLKPSQTYVDHYIMWQWGEWRWMKPMSPVFNWMQSQKSPENWWLTVHGASASTNNSSMSCSVKSLAKLGKRWDKFQENWDLTPKDIDILPTSRFVGCKADYSNWSLGRAYRGRVPTCPNTTPVTTHQSS